MRRLAIIHTDIGKHIGKHIGTLVALAILMSFAIPHTASVQANTDINFHDAITKRYNDNGFPKLKPESPLILKTSFSVDEKLNVYFLLEPSEENRPYIDPANYKMRIRLWNDTWSYTDLGIFGDDWPLTGPTNTLIVVPGYNYIVEMEITFTESEANKNDTFEFSVIIGIKTGGAFNPSDSITHLVQFSEEGPTLPPVTARTEPPPFMLVVAIVSVAVVAVILIWRRKHNKEENEGDEDET